MKRIAWIFVLALVMGLVPAMADSWSWTFTPTDLPLVEAWGTISGTSVAPGEYNIDNGTIHENTLKDTGLLVANPTNSTTPWAVSIFQYDDQLYPTANPLLDSYGLLFQTTGGVYINIWGGDGSGTAPGAGSYTKYFSDGSISPVNGTFAIVATPDGGTTLSLLGLALVGLAGLRRKLSL